MIYKLTNGHVIYVTGTLAQCQAHWAVGSKNVRIVPVNELQSQADEVAAIRLNLRVAS